MTKLKTRTSNSKLNTKSLLLVTLPDNAQAFESEQVVHAGDVHRAASDQFGEAAGGDDFCLLAHLVQQSREDSVYQAEIAEVKARLQAPDRGRADDAIGLADVDARQARGALEQRFRADAEAGGDDAAEILAIFGDRVEGGGGAEIHHDTWSAVLLECGDAVHNAVGADLGRVLVFHRHS